MKQARSFLIAGMLAVLAQGAAAATVACSAVSVQRNYMEVDSSIVSACMASGIGNIGNGANDDFLKTAAAQSIQGLTQVGNNNTNAFTTVDGSGGLGSTGSFTLSGNPWATYAHLYLGFKFGTGGDPDEWFVYKLQSNVTSGSWVFKEATRQGGQGLSHVTLYGVEGSSSRVPAPGSLALVGLALLAAGAARRTRA
jgi:hypothetical protein